MADLTQHNQTRLCHYYAQTEAGLITEELALHRYNQALSAPGQPVDPSQELNLAEFRYLATFCPGGIREGKSLPSWASQGIAEDAFTALPESAPVLDLEQPVKIGGAIKLGGGGIGDSIQVLGDVPLDEPDPPGEGQTVTPIPDEGTATDSAQTSLGGFQVDELDELDELEAKIEEMDAMARTFGESCTGACAAFQGTSAQVVKPKWWLWLGAGIFGVSTVAAVLYMAKPPKRARKRKKRR